MARPIWSGVISFGLLNIPVQLFAGERSTDLKFRMLDNRDKTPIRYERVNAETGDEVPWQDVVKAFEYDKGSYVVIDDDDLKAAAPEAVETVEIEAFVQRDAINPMYFEKPYYLVPGKRAEKGYALLREALVRAKLVGISKVVIRTRQYLAMVMPLDDALVLNLLRFPQEIVDIEEFKLPGKDLKSLRVTEREIAMAQELVKSMTVKWKPEDYKDDFRDRLRALIEQRMQEEGGPPVPTPSRKADEEHAATNVVDFMDLLNRSLRSGKRQPATSSAPAKKKAATTRRKAPAKKAAAPAKKRASARGSRSR